MTGPPRPAHRVTPSQEGVPLTPKSRKQKARPKTSPHRKKTNTAVQSSNQASNPPRLPAFTSLQKRPRPATSPRLEPDAKRAKSVTGVAVAAAASRPKSPTTSSRSRPRKSSKSRGGGDDSSSASNVIAAATSSVRRPKPRAAPRSTTMPAPASCFTIANAAIPSNVKVVSQPQRLFGYEIQCIMHAFGEVRHCSRDVLELMEDAVRSIVHRVAQDACERAAREGCEVRSRHVAFCMRRDPHAMQRLNSCLKMSAESSPNLTIETVVTPRERPWEIISKLGDLEPIETPPEKLSIVNDRQSECTWRSLHAFKMALPPQQFRDFMMCRGISLVHQDSRSRAPKVRGVQRIMLFKDWLCQKGSPLSEEALYALGHVAREVIGAITQTSLLHRYFDDLAKGYGDPRASGWSYPRHLIAALGYGIGTAVSVPLTDMQCDLLRREVENYMNFAASSGNQWKGYVYASSPCLLPQHLKEALRRLSRAPGTRTGFSDSLLEVWGT